MHYMMGKLMIVYLLTPLVIYALCDGWVNGRVHSPGGHVVGKASLASHKRMDSVTG